MFHRLLRFYVGPRPSRGRVIFWVAMSVFGAGVAIYSGVTGLSPYCTALMGTGAVLWWADLVGAYVLYWRRRKTMVAVWDGDKWVLREGRLPKPLSSQVKKS